jgi:stage II sporulation protein D
VTEILIRGSRGDFRMRGFRIRSALKIRETLFVVDRQFGLDGSVQDFIFTGRGWGHGVGLCQVGAYGMALRNERYDRILHHYYTGVKIRKNYGSAFSRP